MEKELAACDARSRQKPLLLDFSVPPEEHVGGVPRFILTRRIRMFTDFIEP